MVRYLTATSLRDFLTCPEKGRLAHVERIRKAKPKAVLAFGTAIHVAIEKFYRQGAEPDKVFESIWGAPENREVDYEFSNGDTHERLLDTGSYVLRKFVHHEQTPKNPHTLEKSRYVEVKGIPFWSTVDFTGDDGKLLLDWKTSSSKYPEYKAALDLQLTAYSYVLAVTERMPEKVGFGVFIKKKEPEIQYVFSASCTKEQLKDFERLVAKVWNDIHTYEGIKTPGPHCAWCDYLPLCLGQEIPEGMYVKMPERYSEPEPDRE